MQQFLVDAECDPSVRATRRQGSSWAPDPRSYPCQWTLFTFACTLWLAGTKEVWQFLSPWSDMYELDDEGSFLHAVGAQLVLPTLSPCPQNVTQVQLPAGKDKPPSQVQQ